MPLQLCLHPSREFERHTEPEGACPSRSSEGCSFQVLGVCTAAMAAGAEADPVKIMFLCLGNICRSPTAEYVFRKRAEAAGLKVEVASSGTASYHVGDGAYGEMVLAARAKGYDMSPHSAQQISAEHFEQYDLVIAMDSSNLSDAKRRFGPRAEPQLRLFLRDFAPGCGTKDTPDPYYERNFAKVVELVEQGSDGLIEAIKAGKEPSRP